MDETSTGSQPTGVFGVAVQEWAAVRPLIAFVLGAAALALIGYLSFVVVQRVLDGVVRRSNALRRAGWTCPLQARHVAARLAFLVPLALVGNWLPYVPAIPQWLLLLLQRGLAVVAVLAAARALEAFLNAIADRHATRQKPGQRPIKGFVQVLTLVAYLMAAVVVIGVVLNRDPLVLLTGIGAMSAILILVFQNTILSFVAGIQLTTNDLIRVGDWIEMSDMGADGTVTEIALNTVIVQNSDKSLTIIPAQNFLSKSFRNWRGMQEGGARRMQRSLSLDLSSVRFLGEDEFEHLNRFALLRQYLAEKKADIAEWTARHPAAQEDVLNSRRLTNVGTFRAYVTRYLRAHPSIVQDATLVVRLLPPGPNGLPLEVYVFVNDVRWDVFEGVQSDIFEHLIAILPEFGLRLFQAPSGSDMRAGMEDVGA